MNEYIKELGKAAEANGHLAASGSTKRTSDQKLTAVVAAPVAESENQRLQFVVSRPIGEELERFRMISDLGSQRELYMSQIALWRWAIRKIGEGKLVGAFDPKDSSITELVLPALENARTHLLENEMAVQKVIREAAKVATQPEDSKSGAASPNNGQKTSFAHHGV